MSNSFRDYKDTFRGNLPTGLTYDSDIARYVVNENRFIPPYKAEDYLTYLLKFGFKTFAIDQFEPSLVFDFDDEYYRTGGLESTFSDSITFTRASSATMVDSTGTLVTVASGEPRVGHHVYNGSAWVNEGLLHESEARTNLITYSQDFTDAAWIKLNAGTLAVDATGPDGTTSAVTLVDNNAGGTGFVYLVEDLTVATSTTYTFSVFAKAYQLSWIGLGFINFTTPPNGVQYFNLSDGSVGSSVSGLSAQSEDLGDGWYRCSCTFTTDVSDTAGQVWIHVAEADGDRTVDLDGTSSILVYGAQFEAGSTPSSYIPTSGSTVTRAAETLTVPAAKLPYSSEAVSIQMDGRMTYADTNNASEAVFVNWGNIVGANPAINLRLTTSTGGTGGLQVLQDDGVTQDAINSVDSYSPGINVPYNIASRHGSTFINGSVDGTALTANTTPTALPDLETTDLNLAFDYMGTVKLFRVWADDLGDTGIEEASA